ncbi:MAG TPA: alpha-amylase family glycosyl hydrolase [Myxococcota bacterium]|nr:alpha-amylase family glycosyl hydrolase [Myxococcota bacterium]
MSARIEAALAPKGTRLARRGEGDFELSRLSCRDRAISRGLAALVFVCAAVVMSGTTCRGGSGAGPYLDAPAWVAKSVGYEIFVRSFFDSDADGVGDLAGILQKLDYLNDGKTGGSDLGVNLLWLTPIFASPSYHGYDVSDYLTVSPELGSLADFRDLAAAAHQRSMRVILDLPLNHTSRLHAWFAASSSGTDDPRHDWYLWRADDPGWRRPWGDHGSVWHLLGDSYYYGIFSAEMPDLNLQNSAVVDQVEAGMRFWLDQGADGFRIDAARYFTEDPDGTLADTAGSHQLAKDLKRALREKRPDALMVAEAWAKSEIVAAYQGRRDEYDLAFNFDLAEVLPQCLLAEDPEEIERVLTRVERSFSSRGFDAPFLENHDFTRLVTSLGGRRWPLKLAAVLLLTLPGTPFLYYGQEIGQADASRCSGDICKRAPMQWTAGSGAGFTSGTPWTPPADGEDGIDVASQAGDPNSLLALYRELIRIRGEWPALTSTARKRLAIDRGAAYAYLRGEGDHPVLVVLNFSSLPEKPTIDLSSVGQPGRELEGEDLFSGRELVVPVTRSRYLLDEIPAWGALVVGF